MFEGEYEHLVALSTLKVARLEAVRGGLPGPEKIARDVERTFLARDKEGGQQGVRQAAANAIGAVVAETDRQSPLRGRE